MMATAPEHSPENSPLQVLTASGQLISFSAINTTNANKLAEFKAAGLSLTPCSVEIEELQPNDHLNRLISKGCFLEASKLIAEDKAYRAFQKHGHPILIEDTSMYLQALPTVTGPLIKQWLQTPEGPAQLCDIARNAANQQASAYFILAIANETERISWAIEINGQISDLPQGEKGFGWDPIFIPEPALQIERYQTTPKTYAELSAEQIIEIAPRRLKVAEALRMSLIPA